MKYTLVLLAFIFPFQGNSTSDMVLIPAGEFWMGRFHMWLLDELGMHLRLRLDDQPAHLVRLDDYFIDKNEVTNEDYARFLQATGHRKPFHWVKGEYSEGEEKYPVYNVSWDDAEAYCKWIGKRLPTEAEWEKAARGGRERTMFPWGDELTPGGARGRGVNEGIEGDALAKRARYGAPNGPTKVGSYAPNGYGLHDMIGNVAEWVADWYNRTYYSVTPDSNPEGPQSGLYRVSRGAGWSVSDERILAASYRNYVNPEHRSNAIGFRCAKTK